MCRGRGGVRRVEGLHLRAGALSSDAWMRATIYANKAAWILNILIFCIDVASLLLGKRLSAPVMGVQGPLLRVLIAKDKDGQARRAQMVGDDFCSLGQDAGVSAWGSVCVCVCVSLTVALLCDACPRSEGQDRSGRRQLAGPWQEADPRPPNLTPVDDNGVHAHPDGA